MRLIDADEFGEILEAYGELDGAALLKDFPTACDVDKVITQLEEKAEDARKYWNEFDDESSFGEMNAYSNAVEIVKSGGVEKRKEPERFSQKKEEKEDTYG